MKRYYKIIDNAEVFFEQPLVTHNGMQVWNPTEEMLMSEGWQEYVPTPTPEPTPEELLQMAKDEKLQELEAYNDSDDVNGFFVNGSELWVPADKRAILRISINAYKALNIPTITKIWDGVEYTFTTEEWDLYLNQVEVYASECLNTTMRHAAMIQALTSVEDVETYDYTLGYPTKPSFTNNKD